MSQTMNQMLALIDRVIKGEEPAPVASSAELLPPVWCASPRVILEEYSLLDELLLEQSRDQRAREWLASLPAAQA